MPGRPLEALTAARRVVTDPVLSKAEENPAWVDFAEDRFEAHSRNPGTL